MAEFVYTDAAVTVNAVDLSDKVRSATLTVSADLQENTAMGSTWRRRIPGLLDSTVELEFNQDFAASEVDATLWAVFIGGAAVTVTIRPDSAAISATNPDFTGSLCLEEYTPLGGEVGEAAMAPVTFQGAGTITRDVSA